MDEYNSNSLPHPEWNRNFTGDQLTDLEKVYVRTRADRIRAAMFPETLLGIAQQQGEEIVPSTQYKMLEYCTNQIVIRNFFRTYFQLFVFPGPPNCGRSTCRACTDAETSNRKLDQLPR